MAPGDNAREWFNWDESLTNARSALEVGDAASGAKVFTALTDAIQMAELCRQDLFDIPPGEISNQTFEGWKAFLWALYNDARTYLKNLELIFPQNEASLQLAVTDICNVGRHASFGMRFLTTRQPEGDSREAQVEILDNLIAKLETAVAILQPMHEAREVKEIMVKPTNDVPENAELEEVVYVPRVGQIAAGFPNLAQQAIEGYYPLPRRLVGTGNLYLLEVSGDSMIDAGISSGDLLVIREQHEAQSGEIVVARTEGQEAVEGNTSVKEFKMENGHAWLIPHNPAYTKTPADTSTIIGKVVTVLHIA